MTRRQSESRETFGQLAARMERRQREQSIAVKPDPRLMGLTHCGDTEDAERRVADAKRALTDAEARQQAAGARGFMYVDERELERATRDIEYAQQQLERCRERDAVQAGRPDGCTCLGTGSRPETGNPCSCAEGQAAQARIDRLNADIRAEQLQKRIEGYREDMPARLRDFTLDTFPAGTAAQKKLIAALRERIEPRGDLNEVQPWVWLAGPQGTGKSCLAKAAGEELIESGMVHEGTFVAVPSLLDRLKATYKHGSTQSEFDVMEEYRDVDLLILDDFGAERSTESGWAGERLFVLINSRYDDQLLTIITSNLLPEELSKHLGDQGPRIVWRMLEACEHQVLSLAGMPNLRAPKTRAKLEVVSA